MKECIFKRPYPFTCISWDIYRYAVAFVTLAD